MAACMYRPRATPRAPDKRVPASHCQPQRTAVPPATKINTANSGRRFVQRSPARLNPRASTTHSARMRGLPTTATFSTRPVRCPHRFASMGPLRSFPTVATGRAFRPTTVHAGPTRTVQATPTAIGRATRASAKYRTCDRANADPLSRLREAVGRGQRPQASIRLDLARQPRSQTTIPIIAFAQRRATLVGLGAAGLAHER